MSLNTIGQVPTTPNTHTYLQHPCCISSHYNPGAGAGAARMPLMHAMLRGSEMRPHEVGVVYRDGTAASGKSGCYHPGSVPATYQLRQATQSPPPPPLPVMTSELPSEAANTVAARSMLSEQLSRRQEDLNKNVAQAMPIMGNTESAALVPPAQQQCTDVVATIATAAGALVAGCSSSGSRASFQGDETSAVQAAQACRPPDLPLAPVAGPNRLKPASTRGLQQSNSEPALLAKSRKGTAASRDTSGFGLGPYGRGGRTMSRRTRDSASRDSSAVVGVSAQSGLSELDMSGEFNLR